MLRSFGVAVTILTWLGAGALGGGTTAQAQTIYRLLPGAGVGITDNASSAPSGPDRHRDEFVTGSVAASVRHTRARSSHGVDAAVIYTQYLEGHGAPALTAGLAWSSLFKLSTIFDLGVGADATLSRTSAIGTTDLTTVTPTTRSTVPSYYVSTGVHETLTYTPTARQVYFETLTASRVSYLDEAAGLPATTVLAAKLHAGWLFSRDSFFLEATGANAFIAGVDAMPDAVPPVPARASGRVIIAALMAGWQHELGITWTSKLSAGPLAIVQTGRTTAYNFGVVAEIDYHSKPWFASLTASQAPVPNLYIGAVTLNDELVARAALPLTQNELTFLSGYAGYLYSRIADDDGIFRHAFDTRTAGAALTTKFKTRPFAISLLYTITDQRGVAMVGGVTPSNFERQTLMLNFTGVFTWGPGTLPLFTGGLDQGGI